MNHTLTVYNYDKPLYALNLELAIQQKCLDNLEEINHVHQLKLIIQDLIVEEKDLTYIKDLVLDLTECEFRLQELWKFPRDSKYHRFWITPRCSCPKIDNNDSYPSGVYVINVNCQLHGLHGDI